MIAILCMAMIYLAAACHQKTQEDPGTQHAAQQRVETTTEPASSACNASQLSATDDRKESDGMDGGLGHHAITIAIQNRSSSPCVLHGVPTLTLSSSMGRTFAVQVCLNCVAYLFDKQPVADIPLEPKKSAYVVVGYNTNDGNGQLQCTKADPNNTIMFNLYLPQQSEPLKLKVFWQRSCGELQITPFLAKPPAGGALSVHSVANARPQR
jgi:hypothetical protein